MKAYDFICTVCASIILVAIFAFVMAWPHQLLWNWLMPQLLELPKITILQSIGFIVLCGFWFKIKSR